METFQIKTHKIGNTYSQPHFFILNKGLNAGMPLSEPCPNCFVITASSQTNRNNLYHLTMMLQIGQYFNLYLKGSVIPFITKNDCSRVIKMAVCKDAEVLKKPLQMIQSLTKKEEEYTFLLEKLAQLKTAYIRSVFKNMALI